MDIFIQNISKSYGEKQVLSHFSCVIPQGSSQAVMAPSGTGKTTLLRLILGLEQPEEGSISGIPAKKSALFQEDRLFPQLSALKNLRMAMPKWNEEEARRLLSELGLEDCLNQPVSTLSGGQARRSSAASAGVGRSCWSPTGRKTCPCWKSRRELRCPLYKHAKIWYEWGVPWGRRETEE